jgi:C-terminal processing protease CtpA/Prc
MSILLLNHNNFPLKSGDEILQIGNGKEQVTNPAVLVHLLRGKANQIVRIGIKRSGQTHTIKFHVNPMKKVTARQGVYVSGLLIADVSYVDRQELGLGNALMVHDVEEGSVAESLKIELNDFLVSVNNKNYQSVKDLYLGLKALASTKTKADFIIKRLYFQDTHLFSYHEVHLPVSNLRFIGPLHE